MVELHWNVVYGPLKSRRFGPSLGVNLQPPDRKICTFNCAYCQYGWTRLEAEGKLPPATAWPKRVQIARAVERELAARGAAGEVIARLTIAGHGEPTLHPEFPAIVRDLRAVRDRVAPSLPDRDPLELDHARPAADPQSARRSRRAAHEARRRRRRDPAADQRRGDARREDRVGPQEAARRAHPGDVRHRPQRPPRQHRPGNRLALAHGDRRPSSPARCTSTPSTSSRPSPSCAPSRPTGWKRSPAACANWAFRSSPTSDA